MANWERSDLEQGSPRGLARGASTLRLSETNIAEIRQPTIEHISSISEAAWSGDAGEAWPSTARISANASRAIEQVMGEITASKRGLTEEYLSSGSSVEQREAFVEVMSACGSDERVRLSLFQKRGGAQTVILMAGLDAAFRGEVRANPETQPQSRLSILLAYVLRNRLSLGVANEIDVMEREIGFLFCDSASASHGGVSWVMRAEDLWSEGLLDGRPDGDPSTSMLDGADRFFETLGSYPERAFEFLADFTQSDARTGCGLSMRDWASPTGFSEAEVEIEPRVPVVLRSAALQLSEGYLDALSPESSVGDIQSAMVRSKVVSGLIDGGGAGALMGAAERSDLELQTEISSAGDAASLVLGLLPIPGGSLVEAGAGAITDAMVGEALDRVFADHSTAAVLVRDADLLRGEALSHAEFANAVALHDILGTDRVGGYPRFSGLAEEEQSWLAGFYQSGGMAEEFRTDGWLVRYEQAYAAAQGDANEGIY